MPIVFSINWSNLGFRRQHQHQIPRRMNWECSKGDVPHSAQIDGLQKRLFFRPLAIGVKARTEVLGLKNLHCSRMHVVRYKSLVLVSTVSTYVLGDLEHFGAFDQHNNLDVLDGCEVLVSRCSTMVSRYMTSFSRTGWLTRWVKGSTSKPVNGRSLVTCWVTCWVT